MNMKGQEEVFKKVELRSEEVQELMGKIPIWILRWGITVLLGIVVVLLLGSYIFKYPDIVEAEITVSTQNPPSYVLAKATGRLLDLYVNNGAEVRQGQLLALIDNTAKIEDMLLLRERMEYWREQEYDAAVGGMLFDERYLQLGEIQGAYTSFMSVLHDYCTFLKQDYYHWKVESSKKQLADRKNYLRLAQNQYELSSMEEQLSKRIYRRDSILFYRNTVAEAEYDESKRIYLQYMQGRESMRMSLSQIEIQIEQGKENLLDIRHQALTEEQKYRVTLKNVIEQLLAGIKSWEQNYLLVAPFNGYLTYMCVWSRNQNVISGESIFVIAPQRESQPVGKALLPIQGSGKVKVGQTVNIRLDNYPDMEFGYVLGRIHSVSPVPTEKGMYVVDIELPAGLVTNYGKRLPLTRELKGDAEIVTEDMRLIERILSPLRKVKQYL